MAIINSHVSPLYRSRWTWRLTVSEHALDDDLRHILSYLVDCCPVDTWHVEQHPRAVYTNDESLVVWLRMMRFGTWSRIDRVEPPAEFDKLAG